jgi:hypothetical protein
MGNEEGKNRGPIFFEVPYSFLFQTFLSQNEHYESTNYLVIRNYFLL